MARPRTLVVRESPAELRRRAAASGELARARVELIALLAERPALTIAEIARETGRPERTVHRWLATYRREGLDGLIAGVAARATPRDAAASDLDGAWLKSFIESVPEEADTLEWLGRLRSSLQEHIAGVDRVGVDLNVHAIRPEPAEYDRTLLLTQGRDGEEGEPPTLDVDEIDDDVPQHVLLLRRMRAEGFDFAEYIEPYVVELASAKGTYVGSIMLWRRRGKGPFPATSIATIERLRPVLLRLLLDCASRHQSSAPLKQLFYLALDELAGEAHLTPAEYRVLALRLLGNTHKQIATRIGTRENTVAKHLSSVHRKTGTQGISELYARFFSPLLT